jgi:alcohol dehydrogenase YqhD (iron-dependent ADH family)
MNINYYNPTNLVFGPGVLSNLGELAGKYGKKALIVTGGGSVKRNGTFDRVADSLKVVGISYAECSGVEPNPKITSVRRGAQIARDENCELVIALGGGSVMDASKVIAAAYYYDGDPWDMVCHGQENWHIPTKALPIITVPTLAATGSEMNNSAVISNKETLAKSFAMGECLYPKLALVDPELTVSVPKDQTAYGVCDIITHVTEAYFNGIDGTPIQDRFAEGVILAAIEYGTKALADGTDIEARSQVQYASIMALNGWVHSGTNCAYPVHMIEHTVFGYEDITHAAGLSIINPSWMRFAARHNTKKFVQFAEGIFGLKGNGPDDLDCALKGIDKFEAFLKSIDCPTRFSDLNIDDKRITNYAQDTLKIVNDGNGKLPARPPMSEKDIVEILKAAL